MKGKCKLCLAETNLRNSHIIPEFMYQKLYNNNPKKFYIINIDNEKSSKKIEQKGIREYLLCNKCEGLLNKFETYVAETIYAKNYQNKAYLEKENENIEKRTILYEFKSFEYSNFKLFLMSLLWRLIISSKFNTIDIGEHKEIMRKAILNENPLKYYQYGCLIQIILYKKGNVAGGFIINPFSTKLNGVNYIHILIDGFMYSFIITDKNTLPDVKENLLKENGKMNILGRLIWDDKDLFIKVKKVYDYYNNEIEKII